MKRLIILSLAFIVASLATANAAGMIYKYKDSQGRLRFYDRQLSDQELSADQLTPIGQEKATETKPDPPGYSRQDRPAETYTNRSSSRPLEHVEETTPTSFGSVTIDKFSFLPVNNWVKLMVTYTNSTSYTFKSSVTIQCRGYKGSTQTGGQTCIIFADDWGKITPGRTIPKECSIFPEVRGTERAECDVIEGR